jgi:recombinational DNA repair protein (RecF pathway)
LAFASLGLEVLGALATHSPPEPFFFEEGITFLEHLGSCSGAGSLAIALLLRLLHHAGFAPQLSEAWTEQTLPPTLTYHFDQGMFAAAQAADSSRAMRLPRPAVAAILPSLLGPPPLDGSLTLPSPAGRPILRWLIRVWQDHLNQPLHAADFLEKMILREP